jgi:hypothetical protein
VFCACGAVRQDNHAACRPEDAMGSGWGKLSWRPRWPARGRDEPTVRPANLTRANSAADAGGGYIAYPNRAQKKTNPKARFCRTGTGTRAADSHAIRAARNSRHSAVLDPCPSGYTQPDNQARLSIGSTSRVVEPTNNWRGRPIFCSGSEIISFHWAIQPMVRAMAKIPVNSDTGIPSADCTMPE